MRVAPPCAPARWQKPEHIRRVSLTVTTVEAAAEAKELRRWMTWLVGSLVAASVFTGMALAGLGSWFLFGAIIAGPGVGGLSLIWLAVTSDTNGLSGVPVADDVAAEAAA
jgi:hypothetical protein